ncbi:MAG: hypothetical protein E5V46_02955 [Mesorhizobium sp.]|nr:MAG: hypothetical protein E5V46_02955 [Mesorhizobium sp.]
MLRIAMTILLLSLFTVFGEAAGGASPPSPEGAWRCERGCGCTPSSPSKSTIIRKAPPVMILNAIQVITVGPVPDLALVNECGQVSGAQTLPNGRIQALGWKIVGQISSSGNAITWSNGSVWVRRPAHPELTDLLKYWEGKVFYCDDPRVPAVHFPSKEPENRAREFCDDGDAIIENALLCYVGDQRGCETVKTSQSANGRWWRSPRKAILQPGEPLLLEKGETTFSNDHALGVMLYLSITQDRNAFNRWIQWINSNDRCRTFCGISPSLTARYCENDNCTLKLNDCPLLELLGAQLNEPVPFCGTFVPFGPPIDLLMKQLNESYETVTSELPIVPPQAKELKGLLDRTMEKTRAIASSIEQLRSKIDQFLVAKSRMANIVTNINSTANRKGFSRHNTMVEVMLLEDWGFGSQELNEAAARVLAISEGGAMEGDNPFFEYVAHRASDRMIELALRKCPPVLPNDTHPRREWMWERAADDTPAFSQSMYWDCIFIGKLWQNGDVMDPQVADTNEQEKAARLVFDQTVKSFEAVKELAEALITQLREGLKNPSSVDWERFRKIVEGQRQRAEELSKEVEKLRQQVTDNLPGSDLSNWGVFDRIPRPPVSPPVKFP